MGLWVPLDPADPSQRVLGYRKGDSGMANETPRPGDCIVFKRSDGLYDVCRVTASSKRETVRESLGYDMARAVAKGNLEAGGRRLHCDHSTPDLFEKP